MKNVKAALLSVLVLATTPVYAVDEFSADQAFGAEMPVHGEAVTLKQAIDQLDANSESMVKIQGQITEVCQAKGCWMILVDGDTYARVTFEDYGFFVPIETSMQRSVVYGVLTETVLTPEQVDLFSIDPASQSALAMTGELT